MKIAAAVLAKKIKEVKGIIPSITPMEALYSILVKDGYLIASNSEQTVMVKLEGMEDNTETFLLPSKAYNLLATLTDGDTEISVDKDSVLKIKNGKIKSTFASMDPKIYCFEVDMKDTGCHEAVIDAELLKSMIGKCLFAIDENATENSVIGNVYLEANDGVLNVCGISHAMMAWNQADYTGQFKILLPIKSAKKLMSLDLKGEARILDNGKIVKFVTDGCIFQCRISEGEFVDYAKFFSELQSWTAVDRQELIQIVSRIYNITQDEKRTLLMNFDKDICDIKYTSSTVDYSETIALDEPFISESPLVIGFDPKYLLDMMKTYPGDSVRLNLQSANMPMQVFTDECRLRSMIMPKRI